MERIGVILASVREGRRGEGFARWIHGLAAAREGVTADLLDLRDWPLPAYTAKVMPTTGEAQYPPGSLEHRWAETIRALDAFVIVTPEYNRGYPGQLKNALDILYPAWSYKPVAMVSYGGFAAGSHASEQLSGVAIELRMVPLRDRVAIRTIGLATDEHGAPSDELYRKRAGVMLDELAWFSRILRDARATRPK